MMKTIGVIVLIVISTFSHTATFSHAISEPFFTNKQLSNHKTWSYQFDPTMAIGQDGAIYVGYGNHEERGTEGLQISFTSSTDGGDNWNEPEDMPFYWDYSWQLFPWMVTYGEGLYFSYFESVHHTGSSPNLQITMKFTDNQGQSWNTVSATNSDTITIRDNFDIDMDGNIYLVYNAILSNFTDMRLSTSFDNGSTFSDNSTIQYSPTPYFNAPYIVAGSEKGELFASWTFAEKYGMINESDIYFSRSTDFGQTWTKGVDLNPSYNASYFDNDLIYGPSRVTRTVMEQASNGRLYILWSDFDTPDGTLGVWLRYSDDKGSTWSDKFLVNDNINGATQWMPDLEIDSNNNVHIIYLEETEGFYAVKYRTFNPDTNQFSNTLTVNNNLLPVPNHNLGSYMTIKLDKNNIPHVVWTDTRVWFTEIYYGHLVNSDNTSDTSKGNIFNLNYILIISFAIMFVKKKLWKRNNRIRRQFRLRVE